MPGLRRTKIVCTIGPATSNRRAIQKLVRAGMDCARLNFSHGTPSEHLRVMHEIRAVSRSSKKPIAIMQDLPGPKIRVGKIHGGSVELKKGMVVSLTTEDIEGTAHRLPVGPKDLPKHVPENVTISLSDGSIRLRVQEITDTEIKCKCEIGGLLLSGKGVNIPQLKQTFETFTERDRRYLAFGLEHDVDLVAVSFVRSARDIQTVRNFVDGKKKRGKVDSSKATIIAKIEKSDALQDLDAIVKASDAVMVARGDLGVENPIEQVPVLQKTIISKCNANAVPVITATQMLESMVTNPSPTRAEVTDVANAIFDGTDALMLSEETAVGRYPVECVEVLDRVSVIAEERLLKSPRRFWNGLVMNDIRDASSHAVSQISMDIGARAIVCPLDHGDMAPRVSRFRPAAIIAGISSEESLLRRSNIVWGVYPIRMRRAVSLRDLIEVSVEALLKEELVKESDRILVVRDGLTLSRETGVMLFVAEATQPTRS